MTADERTSRGSDVEETTSPEECRSHVGERSSHEEEGSPQGNDGGDAPPPAQAAAEPELPRPSPSPLRDRTHWVTLVVLPLIGAVGFWAVQGLWDWAWRSISGPPGLTAFASHAVGGEHLYLDPMESADPATKCKRGVPMAAPGSPASLPITLQAKTDEAIMVIGVEVSVVSSEPSPTDGTVAEPTGCPAALKGRAFDVDLTRVSSPVTPAGKSGSHQATDLPFTVTAEDPEQLNLRLRPGGRDVRFTVKVEWVADGNYGSVTLEGDENREGDGEPGYRVMGRDDSSSAPGSPDGPSPPPSAPANTGSGSRFSG